MPDREVEEKPIINNAMPVSLLTFCHTTAVALSDWCWAGGTKSFDSRHEVVKRVMSGS